MKRLTETELKEIELDILSFIHDFCQKHHLKYWIAFGTLLGAVRHKGFIPWDDDVDVCMPREDYDKFLKLMMRESDERYRLIAQENDEEYYFTFARLVDNRTTLKLRGMREIRKMGVFVDVFPLDIAPPESEKNKWQEEFNILQRKTNCTIPRTAHYQEHSWRTMIKIIRQIPDRFHYGVKNFDTYRKQWRECLIQYNDSEGKEYICQGIEWIYNRSIFDKTIELEFENRKFLAPSKYDEFLKISYGNYMELPPVEKRVSHHHFTAYWK